MFDGAEKYIGRKLNNNGRTYLLEVIKGYGYVPEQCSEEYGVMIYFNRRTYAVKDIKAVKYTPAGYNFTDSLPEEALEHLDTFLTFNTDEA